MNLEVINKWLDEEYGCSYTKLEELHDFYFEKYCDLQQENKILKENAEHNDKVVDKVNWENQLLKKENKQLKDELKSKPDAQITLQDDKGNKFMVIQTERIDMQVELNKTIEKLFNNWNKLKEWVNKHCDYYMNNEDYIGGRLCFTDMKDIMQEIEGSDSNENNNI